MLELAERKNQSSAYSENLFFEDEMCVGFARGMHKTQVLHLQWSSGHGDGWQRLDGTKRTHWDWYLQNVEDENHSGLTMHGQIRMTTMLGKCDSLWRITTQCSLCLSVSMYLCKSRRPQWDKVLTEVGVTFDAVSTGEVLECFGLFAPCSITLLYELFSCKSQKLCPAK